MIEKIPIAKIKSNPFNPRKEYDADSIAELAAEMKEQGIFPGPLLGRRVNGHVEIAYGHRRIAAMKKIGIASVPVELEDLTDEQMEIKALVENIQRKELTQIELADAVARLCQARKKDEVAKQLGFEWTWVAHLVRASQLPKSVKVAVTAGKIDTRSADVGHRLAGTGFVESIVVNNIPQPTVQKIAKEVRSIKDKKVRERVKEAAAQGKITSPDDVIKKVARITKPKDEPLDVGVWLISWSFNTSNLADTMEPLVKHGWAIRNNFGWKDFEKAFSRLEKVVNEIRTAAKPQRDKEN
jgi:ParB family chromosome partitioning protein